MSDYVVARVVFTGGEHADIPLQRNEIDDFESSVKMGMSYWNKHDRGFWIDPKNVRVINYLPAQQAEITQEEIEEEESKEAFLDSEDNCEDC